MSCPMPTASRTLALQRPRISLPNAVISTWVHSTHAASGTSVLVAMASRVYEPPITTESHTHVLQLSEAASQVGQQEVQHAYEGQRGP